MTSLALQASESCADFNERLALLTGELELAVKWQRPYLVLAVCSSEYVREDVEAALKNELVDLGQTCVRLSVRDREPSALLPFLKEFKEPARTIYVIDGMRWGGDEDVAYAAISLQREYLIERQIRAIFWMTPSEIMSVARHVPDFWPYRHRVIEFAESPRAEQGLSETLDYAWQGAGGNVLEPAEAGMRIAMSESMLSELPKGEEATSIRGNLLLSMAVMNWRRGDLEKANELLQEALYIATKLEDNHFEAECFNALALIKSKRGLIDEAIEAYKQALQLAPEHMYVWNNLGNLCTKLGRNDEAMVAFRKALEGNARDPVAWNGLAAVHLKLGYMEEATTAYRRALQYTPTYAQAWCGLGDVHASTGKSDEALQCYHKAIELDKTYVTPWVQLAVLFGKQERHRDAVKAYQKAVELDGGNSQLWNELGSALLKARSYEEAASAFSKAIELNRANAWAYSNLAQAYMHQGRSKEGVSLLLRSIELFQNDAEKAVSWNRLGDLYRTLNDYENAMAAYQTADQLTGGGLEAEVEALPGSQSDETEVVPAAIQASADRKATAEAEGQGEPHPELPQENTEAKRKPFWDAPAWLFRRGGDGRKAKIEDPAGQPALTPAKEEAAVTPAPKSEEAEVQVAEPQEDPGAEPGKRAHMPEAVQWTAKGNEHFGKGAIDEAIRAYSEAIKIDPGYGVPYSNLALAYVTHGQFAEAILLYQKSVELLETNRDKALALNGLGNAYRCVDDYVNAVEAYQRAAALDPETGGIRDRADSFQPRSPQRSAKGWNNLGELLLKTGALEKAEEAFRKAIELDPKYGRAHFNLARTTSAQGKHSEAVPLYEKSIALLESDAEKAEAWNGLGNVYRKLNDYEKAINAYQKAVVLADEGVDLLTRARFSLLSNVSIHQ